MSDESVQSQLNALKKHFPDFLGTTQDYLLGTVWKRPDLSPRDRSLITIAALVATNHPNELSFHIGRAMDNGVTKKEVKEVMYHMAFYAGWPNAVTAMLQAAKVFDEAE